MTSDETQSRRRGRSIGTIGSWPLLLAVLWAGCIFDEDERCSNYQTYVGNNVCVCNEGYELLADGRTCSRIVATAPAAGLGEACTDAAECVAPADYCASSGDGGYCTTSGCTSAVECEIGWYCAEEGGTRYCHEPPSGLGMSCQDDSDCAGLDATFCETFVTHVCLLLGCSAEAPCPNGYTCCDLTPTGFFDGTQCHEGNGCAIGEVVP